MPPFSLLPPPLLCGSNAAKSVNQWPRRTPTCQDGSYTSCGSEWLYRPNCLALCCPLLASLSYISNWPDPPKAGLKMIRLVGCRYPRNLVYSDSPFSLHFLFVFSSQTISEQETGYLFPLVSCLFSWLRYTDRLCVDQEREERSWCVFRDTPDWESQWRVLWSVENFLNSLTGWSNGIFKYWGFPFLCLRYPLSQQYLLPFFNPYLIHIMCQPWLLVVYLSSYKMFRFKDRKKRLRRIKWLV